MAFERALKDPENINPQFRPDLSISQEVVGKTYDNGFESFLKELDKWKARKEKKIRDLKNQSVIEQGFNFKPEINLTS